MFALNRLQMQITALKYTSGNHQLDEEMLELWAAHKRRKLKSLL